MAYEAPLRIAIPTPIDIPTGYGTNSTGKRGGNLRVRCTNKEYDAIALEAAFLGMTLAMFTRHCAIQTAQQLRVHREAGSTSIDAGDIEEDDSIKRARTKLLNRPVKPKRQKASGQLK